MTSHGVLTAKVLTNLKHDINNDSSRSNFLHAVAHAFLKQRIKDFEYPNANTDDWYAYQDQRNKKKEPNAQVILTKIKDVADLIKYYNGENKKQQYDLISRMIVIYDRPFDKTKCQYGRAIDIMLFYFDVKDIRKLFSTYEDFNTLCCKRIEKNDSTFQYLVKALRDIDAV